MKALNKLVSQLSINQKLLVILIFSSITSLLLAGLVLITLEINDFQHTMQDDLSAFARIVGNRSSAALLFDDKKVALQNLAVLSERKEVQISCIYDAHAHVFAYISKTNKPITDCPSPVAITHIRMIFQHMEISQPIEIDQVAIGSIAIYADLSDGYMRKLKSTGLIMLMLILAWILTFFLSRPLLHLVSRPMNDLVRTFTQICNTENYALRAVKVYDDELGMLVKVFNNLIAKVELQNSALLQLVAKVEHQNAALELAKNRYLALYDDNPTIVFNLNENGKILSINRSGAKQLGIIVEDYLYRYLVDLVHQDDVSIVLKLLRDCLDGESEINKQEFRQLSHNHEIIWVRATGKKMLSNNDQVSLLLVCEDITQARLLNEKIIYQATHDALTGLINRSQFDHFLKIALLSAKTDNQQHVLCCMDLDQFKIVNDSCGHLAGDHVLAQVGDLLKINVRRQDVLARLGGDEFGILMQCCQINEAIEICEKLCELIKEFQFIWEGKRFTIGVSIGLTSINLNSNDAVELLKEADTACYVAKDKGRNRAQIYRHDDEELTKRCGELLWVNKIQQGISLDHFCLYGQPIVAIDQMDGPLHFEALIRYKDKHGRIIPPGAFLPAAERYKLAPALDRWVIAQLFAWMAKSDDFLEHLGICSINLSGLSLSDESMLMFIFQQFEIWQIPAHKVCFEVTETAAIANLSYTTNFIQTLQNKGCLFSLDDFGSGLSSFAYLKNLPVDFLKIDGLFVKDILDDHVDLAMVKSINEVGHIMGKKTIAEFVENKNVFNLLKELGLDYAQGNGFSKPVPLDQLAGLHASMELLK